jgi:L-seryl-tRNA(Ser) seleniumtransferase
MDPRRRLPAVSTLLEEPEIQVSMEAHSRPLVMDAIREALSWAGARIKEGESVPEVKDIVTRTEALLARESSQRLRPVVNAAGIILHTGLGRAVLPKDAAKALSKLDRCCNLQIDMETGERGKRNYTTEQLICKLTGAEAAMVVNNNAAATFLILAAMCKGMEVIVSRGQLIEIGGSFRLPDCMRQSGAIMREVGTTNKTHLRDYEEALSENTGAIMRVFPSNYRIVGFSKQVPIPELATLKKKHPFILIDDLGCGALVDLKKFGLPEEPTVPDSIASGADLVCSSGDKLIGGPQAGIITGKKDLIKKLKKHPMTRMLRVCKLTDIALEHTLRLFLDPDTLVKKHHTFRMLTTPVDKLEKKAQQLKKELKKKNPAINIRVAEDASATGGGTMPDHKIPTYVLALSSAGYSTQALSYALRRNEPPIITRISSNEVLLDMRTLLDGEDKIIMDAVQRLEKA